MTRWRFRLQFRSAHKLLLASKYRPNCKSSDASDHRTVKCQNAKRKMPAPARPSPWQKNGAHCWKTGLKTCLTRARARSPRRREMFFSARKTPFSDRRKNCFRAAQQMFAGAFDVTKTYFSLIENVSPIHVLSVKKNASTALSDAVERDRAPAVGQQSPRLF